MNEKHRVQMRIAFGVCLDLEQPTGLGNSAFAQNLPSARALNFHLLAFRSGEQGSTRRPVVNGIYKF